MNPFIDPETSREHFPDLSLGLEVNDFSSPAVDNERLDWSIDTLAHMAQARDHGDGTGLHPISATKASASAHAESFDREVAEQFWRDNRRLGALHTPDRAIDRYHQSPTDRRAGALARGRNDGSLGAADEGAWFLAGHGALASQAERSTDDPSSSAVEHLGALGSSPRESHYLVGSFDLSACGPLSPPCHASPASSSMAGAFLAWHAETVQGLSPLPHTVAPIPSHAGSTVLSDLPRASTACTPGAPRRGAPSGAPMSAAKPPRTPATRHRFSPQRLPQRSPHATSHSSKARGAAATAAPVAMGVSETPERPRRWGQLDSPGFGAVISPIADIGGFAGTPAPRSVRERCSHPSPFAAPVSAVGRRSRSRQGLRDHSHWDGSDASGSATPPTEHDSRGFNASPMRQPAGVMSASDGSFVSGFGAALDYCSGAESSSSARSYGGDDDGGWVSGRARASMPSPRKSGAREVNRSLFSGVQRDSAREEVEGRGDAPRQQEGPGDGDLFSLQR